MAEEEQHDSDKILHESAVEDVVDQELQDVSTHAAIANVAAPSAGYVQAEATATVNALNAALQVLRDAGLIPAT
jgi:fructose-bisphosphate aldolase class 1